jgi:serine/threonine-protein kinase
MEKRWIWPFELEEQIGSGAMGVVYRARFVKNDRRVALKLLPKEVAANATLAARFQREMEILKDLRHPHIVHCFGGTCEGDQWFYAMELIDGGSLSGLLIDQGKLPWRKVIEFGLQICAALEYAHTRGIIHRDLKPGNLLLTKAGKIKLADFGLALVAAETRLTSAGKTMGSLHYMAPEQIQGKPPMSNRTDLYALGCVLFELLTGRTPFVGEVMGEILQQHLRQVPPKVSSFALDCPVALEALVAELLQKDPERRPANAESIIARLREIDEDLTVRAPRFNRNLPVQSSSAQTASVEITRTKAGVNVPLLVALVLSLLVGVWMFIWRTREAGRYELAEGKLVAAMRDTTQPLPVRVFAARSLGDLGHQAHAAVEPLIQIMQDSDPTLRAEAATAIGKIANGDAYRIAELRKLHEREEQTHVREALDTATKALVAKPASSSAIPLVIGGGGLTLFAAVGYWLWKQAKED